MIAEPRRRVIGQPFPPLACPSCRLTLEADARGRECLGCGRRFENVQGIPDLRLEPDRYLSLMADRCKAERLAAIARTTDLAGLARSYYRMTDDVDDSRARRFADHVASAEARGERFARFVPSIGHVLEIGCGSGGSLVHLRGRTVVGVDIALRWLMIARRRTPSSSLVAANAEHLPWADATFDALYADSLVEHLDDPLSAFREFRRVARPGASLVVIGPNRWSLWKDPHVALWGVGWLPRSWQAGYVQARRGCDWPIRLRSVHEVARFAEQSGWRVRSLIAAPAPTTAPSAMMRAYEHVRTIYGFASFLKWFGPLWLVQAEAAA